MRALAHGADFLQVATYHPHFPKEKLSKVLTTLQDVLEACPQVLIAGEPGRLATAILANLSLGRLDQSQVASWTSQLTVKGDDHLA